MNLQLKKAALLLVLGNKPNYTGNRVQAGGSLKISSDEGIVTIESAKSSIDILAASRTNRKFWDIR